MYPLVWFIPRGARLPFLGKADWPKPKNEQLMEAVALELANAGGISMDESEDVLYKIELGEKIKQRYVNIIEKDKNTISVQTELRRL